MTGALSVDPDGLAAVGEAIRASARQLPAAPAVAPGADPMSQLIAARVPTLAVPLDESMTAVEAQQTEFGQKPIAAAGGPTGKPTIAAATTSTGGCSPSPPTTFGRLGLVLCHHHRKAPPGGTRVRRRRFRLG
jgi:hypothetical protein